MRGKWESPARFLDPVNVQLVILWWHHIRQGFVRTMPLEPSLERSLASLGHGHRQIDRPDDLGVSGPAVPAHAVQFYEDDKVFIDSLSEFVGGALGSGGGCIVIATQQHHRKLNEKLGTNGIDLGYVSGAGRYIALDARETLDRIMLEGQPDQQRFEKELGSIVQKTMSRLNFRSGTVSAFGEMVAILWAEGKREEAIKLEHLWSELLGKHKLNLRCAYPIESFANDSDAGMFHEICSGHSSVIPTESYTALEELAARNRLVSSLQQKASEVDAIVEEREKEVAHRKDVEEKLRRSEEFTRNIIESSDDCVKVLDLEGRIQYMSPSGQRALEMTDQSQFLNKRWVDFWKEEDQARAQAALATARDGGVGCFQGDSFTIGGVKKSWDVRITPALDTRGRIERLVAVSRDITELRSAQQLAIQSEKLAAAGRLAATIAHEINNPLEAVTNFIYLAMTAKGLPEDVGRHLEIADRELARVSQIAQQTLGFYRETSRERLISVADLIRDVLVVYERKMAYKQIETAVSISPELKLYGRQGELRQAVSNLLTNAIDASRSGGKIWLRARPSRRWNDGGERGIRITLADNGSGMSPEVQKRIFVPFFTTKAEVGTGIGLWATKTLIEQQGGRLRFRSRQGEKSGTAMTIFLLDSQGSKAA